MTTVKRVFRRILPALIPADPTECLTPEQRFQEFLDILQASSNSRLWLAFLLDPAPSPEASTGSSLDLAARSTGVEDSEAIVSPEIHHDELRIFLGFWLEMPLHDYLDDLEGIGPAVAGAVRQSRPSVPLGRSHAAVAPFNLRTLMDGRSQAPRHSARRVDGPLREAQDLRQTRPSLREARSRGWTRSRAAPADSIIRCPSRSPRSSTISPGRWR